MPAASSGDASVSQNSAWLSAAVQRHVADRIAVVDERVEIGQRAAHAAPQRRLPDRGAPPHHRHARRAAPSANCESESIVAIVVSPGRCAARSAALAGRSRYICSDEAKDRSMPDSRCQHGAAACVACWSWSALLVLAGTVIWIWYQRQAVPPDRRGSAAPPAVATADRAARAPRAAASRTRHPISGRGRPTPRRRPRRPTWPRPSARSLAARPAARCCSWPTFRAASSRPSTTSAARMRRRRSGRSRRRPAASRSARRSGDASRIAQSNSARYDALVQLIESIDVGAGGDALPQRSIRSCRRRTASSAIPNGYFNDRFVEVIDLLLATPEVDRADRGAADRGQGPAAVDPALGALRIRRSATSRR